ncbi:MAG: glycosyltransferase family 4 protein [Patescibacteria group bacterium]
MRIAQITSNAESVPPPKYGGIERVVHTLIEHLVKKGHEVTLFASGDSQTSARLVATSPVSTREMDLENPYHLNEWMIRAVGMGYSMHEEFDIIHDHTGFLMLSLPTAHICPTPTLFTFHGPFTMAHKKTFQLFNRPHVNTISEAQLRNRNGLNFTRTIYNGLDMENYPFAEEDDGYLLFVGRLDEQKGPHFAIQAARALRMPLILAGKLDLANKGYFMKYIEPHLNKNNIKWVGEVDEKKRNKLMSKATCMLHPISFREPFGLTLIEAMACGCPVIAYDKGSIPEIIVNGQTGFVVSDVEEMIEMIDEVGSIDRAACRDHALANYSGEKMATQYEDLYETILANEKDSH